MHYATTVCRDLHCCNRNQSYDTLQKKILRDEICHTETHMLAILIINAVKSFNLELILKSNYIQDCLGIS